MKQILLLCFVGIFLTACARPESKLSIAAASDIKGNYMPSDLTVTDMDWKYTSVSWKTTTKDGKKYFCFGDNPITHAKCKRL